ncbi:MAG: hypothetical protein ACOC6C_01275 [Verrucomicrobiota bacterium]
MDIDNVENETADEENQQGLLSLWGWIGSGALVFIVLIMGVGLVLYFSLPKKESRPDRQRASGATYSGQTRIEDRVQFLPVVTNDVWVPRVIVDLRGLGTDSKVIVQERGGTNSTVADRKLIRGVVVAEDMTARWGGPARRYGVIEDNSSEVLQVGVIRVPDIGTAVSEKADANGARKWRKAKRRLETWQELSDVLKKAVISDVRKWESVCAGLPFGKEADGLVRGYMSGKVEELMKMSERDVLPKEGKSRQRWQDEKEELERELARKDKLNRLLKWSAQDWKPALNELAKADSIDAVAREACRVADVVNAAPYDTDRFAQVAARAIEQRISDILPKNPADLSVDKLQKCRSAFSRMNRECASLKFNRTGFFAVDWSGRITDRIVDAPLSDLASIVSLDIPENSRVRKRILEKAKEVLSQDIETDTQFEAAVQFIEEAPVVDKDAIESLVLACVHYADSRMRFLIQPSKDAVAARKLLEHMDGIVPEKWGWSDRWEKTVQEFSEIRHGGSPSISDMIVYPQGKADIGKKQVAGTKAAFSEFATRLAKIEERLADGSASDRKVEFKEYAARWEEWCRKPDIDTEVTVDRSHGVPLPRLYIRVPDTSTILEPEVEKDGRRYVYAGDEPLVWGQSLKVRLRSGGGREIVETVTIEDHDLTLEWTEEMETWNWADMVDNLNLSLKHLATEDKKDVLRFTVKRLMNEIELLLARSDPGMGSFLKSLEKNTNMPKGLKTIIRSKVQNAVGNQLVKLGAEADQRVWTEKCLKAGWPESYLPRTWSDHDLRECVDAFAANQVRNDHERSLLKLRISKLLDQADFQDAVGVYSQEGLPVEVLQWAWNSCMRHIGIQEKDVKAEKVRGQMWPAFKKHFRKFYTGHGEDRRKLANHLLDWYREIKPFFPKTLGMLGVKIKDEFSEINTGSDSVSVEDWLEKQSSRVQ